MMNFIFMSGKCRGVQIAGDKKLCSIGLEQSRHPPLGISVLLAIGITTDIF